MSSNIFIQEFDYSRAGRMGIEDFFNLYHSTIHVKTVGCEEPTCCCYDVLLFCFKIGDRFFPFCNDRQNLTFTEIQVFFRDEQKVGCEWREGGGTLPFGCEGRGYPSLWL